MDTNDPIAQGRDEQTQTQQDQQQAPQPPAVPEGVQARFDEFTARLREAERRNEQLLMQNNELLAKLTTGLMPQQQAPQEPPLDIDPEEERKLRRLFAQWSKPLETKIQQQEQYIQTREQAQVAAEVDAQVKALKNPALEARVNQLVQAWNSPGSPYKGATKRDALFIALGEATLNQLPGAQQARDELGRFNKQSQVVAPTGGRPVPAQRAPEVEQVLAATEDMNNLSWEQLQKLNEEIDKKYPNGIPLR